MWLFETKYDTKQIISYAFVLIEELHHVQYVYIQLG